MEGFRGTLFTLKDSNKEDSVTCELAKDQLSKNDSLYITAWHIRPKIKNDQFDIKEI